MQSFKNRVGASVAGIVALFVLVGSAAMISGCNTTEGVGKDIKAAGNGIENAAAKAKD